MDAYCYKVPIAWLPLINIIWVGFGTMYSSLYGPNGFCWKVFLMGLLECWVFWIGLCFWWVFFIPALIALAAWIFSAYHGYKIYCKSSGK